MIIAETLPSPDSYTAIGWLCVIIASCAFGFNQVLELVNQARGKAPHPPNAQLEMSIDEIGRRVEALEEWKDQLTLKLEGDKQEILAAGEKRAVDIHAHIERDRKELDVKITSLPESIISILKNCGAI